MKILLFFVLILWLTKIAKDILFWVYLWQLKEYRRDRMRAHFELRSARQLFLNKIFGAKVALFGSSAFFFFDVWQFLFQVIVGLMYAAWGGKTIHDLYRKRFRIPVITHKAVGISATALCFVFFLGVLTYAQFSSHLFLLSLLLLDIFAAGIVSSIVGVLKFPSDFMKRRILAQARLKRQSFKDLLVVGITGSYGKTSVKEYLAHILGGKLKVLKTKENQNTEIGIAKCILDNLNQSYDVFVVEMGAYREGEIKKICDMVQPRIGILTGINEQHLSLFGSLEKTIKAKYELIRALPKSGLAIFNGENDCTRALYEKTTIPKRMYALRSFSVSTSPDMTSEKIDFTNTGMQFYVKQNDQRELFETTLRGKHNVLNILGASLAAGELGMTLAEINERVKTLKALPHTLDIKNGINGTKIIDDSYSANPRGVFAALEVLEALKGNKKVLVMYPLIELGKEARDIHRKIAARIDKVCDLCILTSQDFSREVTKNAVNTEVLVISEPKNIIQKLEKTLKEGDIVLLENRVPDEVKAALISS